MCSSGVVVQNSMLSSEETLYAWFNAPLEDADPELFDVIRQEKTQQKSGLEMLASENFTSLSVLQCLSTCLHDKDSEGLPGRRYYGGTHNIDQLERLAQERALMAFNLKSSEWGVNVQPYSGTVANLAVLMGVVFPHGRIMSLDYPDGGHWSHGYRTLTKCISSTAIFFETLSYKVHATTGIIDYEDLEQTANRFKPALIIAGSGSYSRCIDYKRFRDVADKIGAILFCDMSHIAGLVAAGVTASPFQYSDIVSTTTHNTLRGPRAAMIFYRKGVKHMADANGPTMYHDFANKINGAIFPGLQSAPHNNAIAGIATAMRQTLHPVFKQYQRQVVSNAKRLARAFMKRGYKIISGGTDVPFLVVDFRETNITGYRAEEILNAVSIVANKVPVTGDYDDYDDDDDDESAFSPSGLLLGTSALTTRGFKERDMDRICAFIDEAIRISLQVQAISSNSSDDYNNVLTYNSIILVRIHQLREKVETFSELFPLPGYTDY